MRRHDLSPEPGVIYINESVTNIDVPNRSTRRCELCGHLVASDAPFWEQHQAYHLKQRPQ